MQENEIDGHYIEFKDELLNNEKIEWSGKPKGGILISTLDILLSPFALWFGGVALWAGAMMISNSTIFFKFWGILCFLFGIHIIIGRFIVDKKRREKIFYAVTDSRILIKSGLFKQKITSLDIQKLPRLSIIEKKNGVGTIRFDGANEFDVLTSPKNYNKKYSNDDSPKFEMIEDVHFVYSQIVRLQEGFNDS